MDVARLIQILQDARPDAEVKVTLAGDAGRVGVQVVDIADDLRHDKCVVIVGGLSPYHAG